jgi:hypothetical protein
MFMLDFLIAHNDQEFFRLETMEPTLTQDTTSRTSPSKKGSVQGLTREQKDCVDHLLNLIKIYFERRYFDGKNLFKILSKCSDQEDIRLKIFELVFLVCFFCKDIDTHRFDIYLEGDDKKEYGNIFNSACNSLSDACNPVITKCIF